MEAQAAADPRTSLPSVHHLLLLRIPQRAAARATGAGRTRGRRQSRGHHAGREGDGGGHAGEDAGAGDGGDVQGPRPLRRPRLPEHRGSHQEGNRPVPVAVLTSLSVLEGGHRNELCNCKSEI